MRNDICTGLDEYGIWVKIDNQRIFMKIDRFDVCIRISMSEVYLKWHNSHWWLQYFYRHKLMQMTESMWYPLVRIIIPWFGKIVCNRLSRCGAKSNRGNSMQQQWRIKFLVELQTEIQTSQTLQWIWFLCLGATQFTVTSVI